MMQKANVSQGRKERIVCGEEKTYLAVVVNDRSLGSCCRRHYVHEKIKVETMERRKVKKSGRRREK
jgi:hypothetical protein